MCFVLILGLAADSCPFRLAKWLPNSYHSPMPAYTSIKLSSKTCHEDPQTKKRFGFSVLLTSVFDGEKTPCPDSFTPEKEIRYRRLGGPQDSSGMMQKFSTSTAMRSLDHSPGNFITCLIHTIYYNLLATRVLPQTDLLSRKLLYVCV